MLTRITLHQRPTADTWWCSTCDVAGDDFTTYRQHLAEHLDAGAVVEITRTPHEQLRVPFDPVAVGAR